MSPTRRFSPESPCHGPVRPRSRCHTCRGAGRRVRRRRHRPRPPHGDHEEVDLGDPLLRDAPLAALRPPLREGGTPPARDRPPHARRRARPRRHARARQLARRKAQADRERLLASFERSPQKAICHVFGSYCGEALSVARCESGYSAERPERPVPRPLPDGDERAPALRPRRVRARAGPGGVPLLRALGPRLEPVVVQAVVLSSSHETCAKCGTRAAGRVPTARDRW